jgi:flagellar basal body P-ring formation protein FlgA
MFNGKNLLLAVGLAICVSLGAVVPEALATQSVEPVRDNLDSKHMLVSQTQRWVAHDRQVDLSAVEVAPSDRRLIIPQCNSPFEFSYPFATSQKTLRASCPDSGWQIFLGVNIHQSNNALRYTGSFDAGYQLQAEDIEVVSLSSPIAGLAEASVATAGYSLNVAVRAGDLVMQRQLATTVEAFRLTRDVSAGETIDSNSLEIIKLARENLTEKQGLSAQRLDGARAARDLKRGRLLLSYDIKERNAVLMTRASVARGQALTGENVAIGEYFGRLPSDALETIESTRHMQAIRNLSAGSLVRLSDLTPINIIRKGDNVQLSVTSGALQITVTMLALENARLDERVLLLNPESGEEIQAIATGIGHARGI